MNNAQRIQNAIKWIDKLRTTRMKQGKHRLGDSKNGRCCLGVGCEALGVKYSPDSSDSEELKMSVGLLSKIGRTVDETESPLVVLNDVRGFSFKEIAQVLIANPELRFTPAVAKGIKRHYS